MLVFSSNKDWLVQMISEVDDDNDDEDDLMIMIVVPVSVFFWVVVFSHFYLVPKRQVFLYTFHFFFLWRLWQVHTYQ